MTTIPDQRPADGHPAFRRGRLIRWGVGLAVIGALVLADCALVRGSSAGYAVNGATWRIEAHNVPALLRAWNQLDTVADMRAASPALHHEIPLAIRRMTGIRPTPLRARLWLGERFLLSGDDQGWCLSLRPGLLMRLAGIVVSPLRSAQPEDFWAGYASGWRDGHLLVASSARYLDRMQSAGAAQAATVDDPEVLRLRWEGETAGTLDLAAREDLPLRLALDGPAEGAARLHFADAWPDAMVRVNLHRGGPAERLLSGLLAWGGRQFVPETAALISAIAREAWPAYCPLDLTAFSAGEWAFGLESVDLNPDVPVIETRWAARPGDYPAPTGWPPAGAREHRWNDQSGWIIPVPGAARAWALAERDGIWLLSSSEADMAARLAEAPVEPEIGLGAFRLHWSPAAAIAISAIRRAARDGLVSGMDEDYLEGVLIPRIQSFAGWGTLQFQLRDDAGAITGEGTLARNGESVP